MVRYYRGVKITAHAWPRRPDGSGRRGAATSWEVESIRCNRVLENCQRAAALGAAHALHAGTLAAVRRRIDYVLH